MNKDIDKDNDATRVNDPQRTPKNRRDIKGIKVPFLFQIKAGYSCMQPNNTTLKITNLRISTHRLSIISDLDLPTKMCYHVFFFMVMRNPFHKIGLIMSDCTSLRALMSSTLTMLNKCR